MKTYCGILDSYGLASLCRKTIESSSDLYKEAENIGSCYFELDLSESQADIFKDLNKQNDAIGAVRALVQFGGDQISVPDHKSDSWDEILTLMEINKK